MPEIVAKVEASADDAFEDTDGDVVIDGGSLEILAPGRWGAVRFNVTIPDDSVITAAWLRFSLPGSGNDSPIVTIYGEDVANAAVYVAGTATYTISSRDRTTASVLWDHVDLGGPGWFSSPSIVSIVRELFASYSYAEGAYMGFMLTELISDPARSLNVNQYDAHPSEAAELYIQYVDAADMGAQGTTTMLLLRLAGGA